MKKQPIMKGNSMRKIVLSFVALLISMNHYAASNLHQKDDANPTYQIQWVSKATLPLPHRNGEAIACKGKIYFMGGYCPDTEEVRENSNYEYDSQKDKWTIKADIPVGRSNFAIASFEDRIFVIGGDPVLPNNDLYLPGEDKWEVLAPLTLPRQHIDCGRIGNKIYVVGGLVRDVNPPEDSEQKIPKKVTDTVEIYDIDKNKWEMGKPLHDACQGVQVAAVDGKLYVIGGVYVRNEEVALSSEFMKYDPESDSWESLPDLPVPILAPGIAVIKGKIFVIGGSAIENGAQSASDKVYVYDVDKNRWGMASPLPKGIQFPGVAFIDNRIYVIGGCDKEFKAYDSVYEGRF
jgi:N-acetylneuraminic acid mutarotase